MSQPKRYTICLEGKTRDGNQLLCELRLTLIGTLGIHQDSYLTRLLSNFEDGLQTILRAEHVAFSRKSQVSELEN